MAIRSPRRRSRNGIYVTAACKRSGLLRLDIGRADDLAPFLGVFGDDLGEIGRRAGQCGAADVGESRFDFWLGEAGVDPLVEPVDYLGRRVPVRADAVLRARLVAGLEVADA